MRERLFSILRVIIVAVLAAVVAATVMGLLDVPAKVHGWLLGGGAVLFAISEMYFRSLLQELNSLFRRGGYSQWQMEDLQQTIPKLRNRIWQLWRFSMILKAIVGVLAVLLQSDKLSVRQTSCVIYAGYALLVVTFILSHWAKRNFVQIEKLCDDIAIKEVEIKEAKKLKSEMTSGNPHDFNSDSVLGSYQKPARPYKNIRL